MRILFVISQLADFTGDAGLVIGLAESLQKLNHEILIVTTDADPFLNDDDSSKKYSEQRQLFSNNIEQRIEINGIQVIPLHCTSNKLGMYCPNAKKFGSDLVGQFDIVHIFSWYHHIGIVFSNLAQKYNLPYIFTAFASLQPDAQNFFKRRKQLIDMMYTKKMIKHAAALHAVGDSEIPVFESYGIESKKIYMIENGVDLKTFEIKEPTKILEKVGIDENQKFILFFGRIHKKKGIEYLLNAFQKFVKKYGDYVLVIGGHGEKNYVDEIKTLIKTLGIQKLVKFTDYVSHSEKLKLMQSAEVFVLTSLTDVHPRAVQEALVMKTPVIISKECDCPGVEEFEAGKIVQLDSDKVHEALVDLLTNSETLDKYSKNSVKLVQEKYLLENQMKKIIDMYNNVVSNHEYD
jgi:glycosyltransferase involved in cell wall biosynthesis